MDVLWILRGALRQLEETKDLRKDSPAVANLRSDMIRIIAELDAAQAARPAESGDAHRG